MKPITITETDGCAMIEGDTRLLQLIVRSAKADIDAMSMNKGSAEYRAVYGVLSLVLGQASPWPEHGKVAEPSVIMRLLAGEREAESVIIAAGDTTLTFDQSADNLDDLFA